MIGALFIGYLWSDGVWEYREVGNYPFRMNKITGTTQYIGEVSNGWKTVGKQ
ncbi:MAG: hypothetical protein V2A75_08100 [Pseudomonadota bacterium]